MKLVTSTDMKELLNSTSMLMILSIIIYIVLETTISKKFTKIPKFLTIPFCAALAFGFFYVLSKAFLFII